MEPVDEYIPVHKGSIIIQDDQVRCMVLQVFQSLSAAFKDAVCLERGGGFHILPVDGGHHRVVFNDHDVIHHWYSFLVKVRVKQVPSPSSVSMEISPPQRSTI